MEFILQLLLILLCTKVAGHVSVKLGQPSVLGKLLVGIILGPALLGWVQSSEFIHYFSEIGVLLLMFIAGLETDLDQLKRNWKSSFAVAVGGIILPIIGGFAIGQAFGWEQAYSLFLGVLLSATSVSISVQVLKDMDQLNSKEGSTILGAAIVDDVLVVILLAFLMSFLGTGDNVSIPMIIGKKLLFFVVIILAGWAIVPKFLNVFNRFKITEPIITISLIICFAFAYFADLLGMAGIIGAFAAGIAISQTSFKHQVEHKIEPIAYSLFVPVFFVSIGLNVTFDGVAEQLWFVTALLIIAVITKLLGGALGARLSGFNRQSSLSVGAGMISRGEVALIIMTTGLQSGLLPEQYYTSIVIVIIATTLVAPIVLKALFNRMVKTEHQHKVISG